MLWNWAGDRACVSHGDNFIIYYVLWIRECYFLNAGRWFFPASVYFAKSCGNDIFGTKIFSYINFSMDFMQREILY